MTHACCTVLEERECSPFADWLADWILDMLGNFNLGYFSFLFFQEIFFNYYLYKTCPKQAVLLDFLIFCLLYIWVAYLLVIRHLTFDTCFSESDSSFPVGTEGAPPYFTGADRFFVVLITSAPSLPPLPRPPPPPLLCSQAPSSAPRWE